MTRTLPVEFVDKSGDGFVPKQAKTHPKPVLCVSPSCRMKRRGRRRRRDGPVEPSERGRDRRVAVERLDSRESERRPDPLGRARSPPCASFSYFAQRCYKVYAHRTPLPAHERGWRQGIGPAAQTLGVWMTRASLERVPTGMPMARRSSASRSARVSTSRMSSWQHGTEALEPEGGQGAFERRTSKR